MPCTHQKGLRSQDVVVIDDVSQQAQDAPRLLLGAGTILKKTPQHLIINPGNP